VLGVRLPKWSRAIPLVPRGRLRSTEGRDGLRAREGSGDGMPSREDSSDGMPSREGSSEQQADAAIVFIPSCSARIMGLPRGEELSSTEVFLILAERAGVGVFVPEDLAGSCCGLAWGSKGFVDEHQLMADRLIEKLLRWSDGGRLPIVIEGSSCLQSLKTAATERGLVVLDVLEIARDRLIPNLKIDRLDRRVVLHPSCAARKMELAGALQQIAERCARSVEVPVNLTCCGMAGDRGLIYPELSAAAIFAEGAEIRAAHADGYYSNNLTCEIGMSQASGVDYRSILYLLEEASR
jgi:D-lactate dehydrogenase